MLRKGKLQLPYTPTAKNTKGLKKEAREGGGAQLCGIMTSVKHNSSSCQQ